MVGAGAQAELVLRGLAELRPVRSLTVCDLDAGRAAAFAARHGDRLGVPASVAPDPRAAVRDTAIVVTATWAAPPAAARRRRRARNARHLARRRRGPARPNWAPTC
ncbi:hypothetical protein [Actinomadura sp. CNU-125]|uniref:hypothetical protein n=1 Tax=Actinomadura sp. CNU-125 TaxID=1904961 RepID=UPI0021CC719D|nr:hypothetical protein [Actinomadura sp. CNU-125]